jgi:hypothetical protein
VAQLAVGKVATQSVPIPLMNVTVPPAVDESPDTESVSGEPYPMDAGDADSVNDGVAIVTVKPAPVALVPLWLVSPPYVAVTVYEPAASVGSVWQLMSGRSAVQSVDPPDVKVRVPVAAAVKPAIESVSWSPKGMLAGEAPSVIDVLALVTVKLAPVALEPL